MKRYPLLEIRWRLQRHTAIWFAHLALYMFSVVFAYTRPQGSLFWVETGISNVVPVTLLFWLAGLIVHGLWLLLKIVRTRAVLQKMEREEEQQHELEVLRLKVMLAQASSNNLSENQESDNSQTNDLYMEKSKRTSRLRDS